MFNFSSTTFNALDKNWQHQFCINYAMQVYKSDAIYTLIPKNGCSTLRLSIAIANGCIDNVEQGNWIHTNNHTFKPTLKDAVTARYKFVILRCPFRRLASVFLDKFVAKEPEAWQYRDLLNREVDLNELTFQDFVKTLQVPSRITANVHWRPQSSFLLYREYDDYFALEHFDKIVTLLKKKIDLKVVDARTLTSHGTDRFSTLCDSSYHQTAAFDIAALKREGKCPTHESLYTPELVEIVRRLYASDIKLYSKHCNKEDLLFKQT